MAKFLFLLLIGFIIYHMIRGYARRMRQDQEKPRMSIPEDMVRCGRCGVHLPRSESIKTGDKFYCCEDHRPVA